MLTKRLLGLTAAGPAAAVLWQLSDVHRTDTGRWFLIVVLLILAIGGIALLVHGFIDLQRDSFAHTETHHDDKRKAA